MIIHKSGLHGFRCQYDGNGSVDVIGRNISTDHKLAYIRISYLDGSIFLKFIGRLRRSQ